jgi:drug/metabolite transporter (DMT)-like permease
MSASASPSAPFEANHARGLVFGLIGGISISLGGPIVRLIEVADGWQFLTWRCLTFAVLMFAMAAVRLGGPGAVVAEVRRLGWLAPAIAVALGLGMTAYVFALLHTTVANATFVIGSSPLFTVLAARVLLGERMGMRALAALLTAMAGIFIMFGEGLWTGRLTGNLIALIAMVCYSGYVILLRRARGADTFVASGLGGLFAAAAAFVMARGAVAVPAHDLVLACLSGIVQIGLGFIFITLALRHIQAAELTLLILIEAVLGPLLVWLLVDEVPSALTLAGGAVVLASVAAYAVISMRQPRRAVSTKTAPSATPFRRG